MTRGAVLLLACALGLRAQAPSGEPTTEQLEQENAAMRRLLLDYGGLTRYGSDNAELKLPADQARVVFLGDEITEQWTSFFPGKPYFNRGIARQTSPQLLVRFRQDVIALKPKVVVIHTGTNDFAAVLGPITEAMTAENVMSMVELAKANNIRVVLASVLPVCDCAGKHQSGRRPAGKIIGLNNWLQEYAGRVGAVYLNYHGALVQNRAFRKELTVDGFVPNEAGYKVMADLAEKAVATALGSQDPPPADLQR